MPCHLKNRIAKTNAVKHSSNTGDIQIKSSRIKGLPRFAIIVHGCGITSEQIECIFDKFYLADFCDPAVIGLGPGMSIIKVMIDGHGEWCRDETTARIGTSITLDIPYRKARHTDSFARQAESCQP